MGSDASFFVTYAHEDSAYVVTLVDHLRRFGVPVWHDADMQWGDRFTDEIRKRISNALGMIAIMSPAAQESDWVEREILEGQRHDREFLPVLLRGARLFLLASSHYFDARNGTLPGEREIRQLRRIRHAREAGAERPAPSLTLPPLRAEPPRMEQIRVAVPVARPTAPESPPVNWRRIPATLAEGLFEHADILTTQLLLEAAGRLGDGWLRRSDGDKLPFSLLHDIDAIWSEHSTGAQGFLAQLAMHGAPPAGTPAGRQGDFTGLAMAVGWQATRRNAIPTYGTFVGQLDAGRGFFPTLRNPQLERHSSWYFKWLETVMSVHLRLRQWGGH